MNKDTITMTATDQHRAQILTQLVAGQLTPAEAAQLLARSERQVRRLAAAYASAGPAALVHGNRGRPPAHTLPADTRQEILRLAQERYAGFNTQHLTEKLQEEHQLRVSRASVRRILTAAGLRPPRTRRAAP